MIEKALFTAGAALVTIGAALSPFIDRFANLDMVFVPIIGGLVLCMVSCIVAMWRTP